MKRAILLLVLFLGVIIRMNSQNTPQLGKNSIEQVISAMTLDEKVRLLVGMGMDMPGMPQLDKNQGNAPVIGSTKNKVDGAAGTTAAFERLGIPTVIVADGPSGLRISPTRANESKTYYATAFPIPTLLASSWNKELVFKVGAAMGNEVKEYGVDVLLGPGMNIQRNALGGRNFEYYSEDPYLTGKMAASMVNGIQSNGVGTSIKHFAANNNETNRNTLNVVVNERALREIYLKGFEIAVKESQPWTVMSSYNKINGTYTSESYDLLTKILRQDWGFKGLVMTDWFGGSNAIEQVKAGNDLLMPGSPKQINEIVDAVKSGKLDEKTVNENVSRLLNIIKLTQSFKGAIASNQPDLKAHGEVARQSAAEGMILLKNMNNALPLTYGKTIAAFGNHSFDLISGGTGSGDVNEAYTISLIEGLKNSGYTLNEKLKSTYESYLQTEKEKQPKKAMFFMPSPVIPEMILSKEDIATYAINDFAVITIGRVSGEFFDRKVENDFNLSTNEQELIQNVSTIFHSKGKKVIVVLNIGGAIETASWKDNVDAILLAWQPGQEAGNAIADIITGKANPSGKLATTFLNKFEEDPTAKGFPGKEYGDEIDLGFFKTRLMEIVYNEGIYVGYRAYDKNNIVPSFEFGFGLSYTNFEYSNLKLSNSAFMDKITVSVAVKNTGKVAGKEVVQLYISAPQKRLDKPVQELKAFDKTRLLQPNESQILTFDIDKTSLASFDVSKSSWIAEEGSYTVKIGASSRNIKLQDTFSLPEELIVEKVNKALSTTNSGNPN